MRSHPNGSAGFATDEFYYDDGEWFPMIDSKELKDEHRRSHLARLEYEPQYPFAADVRITPDFEVSGRIIDRDGMAGNSRSGRSSRWVMRSQMPPCPASPADRQASPPLAALAPLT